jgi:hypothetical protein
MQASLSLNQTIPYTCPSAICEWSAYGTLGVCNECASIASTVPRNITDQDDNYATAQYSMPGGDTAKLDLSHNESGWSPFSGVRQSVFVLGNQSNNWIGGSPLDSTFISPGPLLSISSIALEGFTVHSLDQVPLPDAWQCNITLCYHHFDGTRVEAGQLSNSRTTSTPLVLLLQQCVTADETGLLLTTCPVVLAGTPMPTAAQLNNSRLSFGVGQDTGIYWIPIDVYTEFQNSLRQAMQTSDPSLLMMPVLFGNTSIVDLVESITGPLDILVRTGRNWTTVAGTVLTPVTHVQVTWAWLAFPAALACLTLMLLLATILQSHGQDQAIWKSSTLALLFHGAVEKPLGNVDTLHEMQGIARSVRIQLLSDNNGGKILVRA